MKSKTLGILLVLVIMLAGAAYFMTGSEKRAVSGGEMGDKMFDPLPVNAIETIVINDAKESVTLKGKGEAWAVADRLEYPADIEMIADFVQKLKDVKIGRKFKSDSTLLARLVLYPPTTDGVPDEQKGIRIQIRGERDRLLYDVVLGTNRQGTGLGGRYLMRTGSSDIFLVDKGFKFLSTKPSNWIDHKLIAVEKTGIKSVESFLPGKNRPEFRLERGAGSEKFTLSPIPKGRAANDSKVNRLAEAIAPLRIEDVAPASDLPILNDPVRRIDYRLFDGTVYSITIGKRNDSLSQGVYPIRLAVRSEPVNDEKPEDASAGVKTEKKDNETTDWTYLISDWEHDSFMLALDELLADTGTKRDGIP